MKLDVYHAFYLLISQAFLGGFVILLIDFRKPVPTWRKRWIAAVALVVGANCLALLFLNFWNLYQRVGVVTVTLPYIVITLWCSRHRDFRAVFSVVTGLFVGCIGTANSMLAELVLQGRPYSEYYSLAVRIVSFFLMFFVLRRFSVTYRQMLHQLNRSWGFLCLIPFASFLIVLYAINRSAHSAAVIVLIYGLLIVCSGAYYLMYLFNPCNEAVRFDDQGLPMAQQEGHGMGVRSIVAFCRKHDAVCQFDLTDGTFRLRIVL